MYYKTKPLDHNGKKMNKEQQKTTLLPCSSGTKLLPKTGWDWLESSVNQAICAISCLSCLKINS